jgi:hypothetical protein
MRGIVLLLGLLGAVGSGFLGYKWYSDANDPEYKAKIELARSLAEAMDKENVPGNEEGKASIAEYERSVKAAYFLLAGLPLGIAGAVLAFLGRPKSGAALLLVAVIGPAVLNWRSLVFTFPLLIAGILCFLVKEKPAVQPAYPVMGR